MFTRAISQVRPLVVVDFDETITCKDTIASLAQFAYSRKPQSDLPPWSHFTNAYMSDYIQHKQQWQTKQDNISKLEEKTAQLSSLRSVELASIDRISNAGVFAGLRRAEIQVGAKADVKIRDQARNVLQNISENLYILSVNWSKDWIIGALDPLQIKPSAVLSNDLEFENQVSTGNIIPNVITASDKLAIFQDLVNSSKDSYSLYVGDSETDLPCLGIQVEDIEKAKHSLSKAKGKILYQTYKWEDIATLLSELQ
ncbi:hypothetical protein NQZ79_g6721 [Umbelopsis isabellina]|nr:hypothetical protein NQZ79_g6721 [Umbelopsis isabellina]